MLHVFVTAWLWRQVLDGHIDGHFARVLEFEGQREAFASHERGAQFEEHDVVAAGLELDLATGRGTEVTLDQEIKNSNLLNWLFPDDWQVVEELRLKAALRNEDGRYAVEIVFKEREKKTVEVDLTESKNLGIILL